MEVLAIPVCQQAMSKIAAQPAGAAKATWFGILSRGRLLCLVASFPS